MVRFCPLCSCKFLFLIAIVFIHRCVEKSLGECSLVFLNVSKETELKLRKKKAEEIRMTKRTLKFLASNRARRFEDSLSVEEIVAGVLEDFVEAVSKISDRNRKVIAQERTAQEIIRSFNMGKSGKYLLQDYGWA